MEFHLGERLPGAVRIAALCSGRGAPIGRARGLDSATVEAGRRKHQSHARDMEALIVHRKITEPWQDSVAMEANLTTSSVVAASECPGLHGRSARTLRESKWFTRSLPPSHLGACAAMVVQASNWYRSRMVEAVLGRFSTLLLILSLVLGPAGSGMRAASMSAKMAPIALSAAHASDNCGDCAANKNGVPVNACSLYCAGMVAVSPADVATIDNVPAETRRYYTPRLLAGHYISPDPYPPRPVVLS